MRILYASARPPYPFFLGGAARCAHMLMHNLALDHSAECTAVGSGVYGVTPWSYPDPSDYEALGVIRNRGGIIDCGYPVHILSDFTNALSAFIDEFKPDIIWSQLEGAREILELAVNKGIQGLYYVHDAEFDPKELQAIADLGCHLVCSSGFLAEKTRRVIGRPAYVIYPAAELYFGTQCDPDGFVTMINPHRVKGLATFLEIAKRMPEQRFLLLESWKLNDKALGELETQLMQVPNIQFLRRVSDMRNIYRQTKLLLIPSVWEEGFGMVAIEAQSCHIPVIASSRGGLPESVGDGGILISDYLNSNKWVEAIEQVLNNEDMYRKLAERAYQHAGAIDFVPARLAGRLLEVCSSEPPRTVMVDRLSHNFHRILGKTPFFWRFFNKVER